MGIILEKVYAKNFESLIKEKILSPAKMEYTLTTDFSAENKVVGSDFNGVQQNFLNWNSISAPAGLLKSNASDMTKFLKTLLSNKGEISKATQITENTFYKNTEKEIGFGQQMERSGNDVFYYKTGNTMACSAILAYDKLSNWGIIILLNQNNSKLIGELIDTNYKQVLEEKSLSKSTAKKSKQK
jgi:CubicO group peptidase (beta-lactamase class C family)